jgi:2Fe-2S ferredoxin
METATRDQIPEVGSDCGGLCSCASCHVYVDPGWFDKFSAMSRNEDVLLSLLQAERHQNSRLSCQLKLTESHDGLVVHTVAPIDLA